MTAPEFDAPGSGGGPGVSVILPVYNGAETISDTVASVLQQTFTDIELIVIDDGSNDRTLDILNPIADPRIRILSFENKGLSASRNRGIGAAAADFVAFIDADDLWTATKLEQQVEALRKNPGAALVYSWSDLMDENDRYLNTGSHVSAEGQIYNELLNGNFLDNGSNPLVRKSVFVELGMFDEALTAAEDWDMWLRIAFEHPIVCVPAVQIYYRVHSAAMSSSIERQEVQCMKVFLASLDRLEPSAERESLRQTGQRNLYRYFAARVAQTGTGPGTAATAARYLNKFWSITPSRIRDFPQLLILWIKIGLIRLLPERVARAVLRRIALIRGRGWKISIKTG